jgi:hypothetical protein
MGDNPSSRGVFIDKFCNSLRVQNRARVPRINSVLDTPAGEAGNFTFNIPDKLPYYSDGLNWIPFGQGSAPGCSNVYVVEEGTTNPSNYATINLALTAAIADGRSVLDPAIICICPSSVMPPYNEDFTVRPGFHLTSPGGLGFVTAVTGRVTFDNTGFPPPPASLFGNDNFITGIIFFHVDGLGTSVTITGPEEGSVRFSYGGMGSLSPTFHSLDINGTMIETDLDSCGIVNFSGPAITFSGGDLTMTNCILTFSGGDFLTLSGTADSCNIFSSRIFCMGRGINMVGTGNLFLKNSFVVTVGSDPAFESSTGVENITIHQSSIAGLSTGSVAIIGGGGGGGTFITASTLQGATGTVLDARTGVRVTGTDIFAGGPGLETGTIIDLAPGSGRSNFIGCNIGGGSSLNPIVNIQTGQQMSDNPTFVGCYILNQSQTFPPANAVTTAGRADFTGCSIVSAGTCVDILAAPPAPMSLPRFVELNSCRISTVPAGGFAVADPCIDIAAGLDPTGGGGGGEVLLNRGSPVRIRSTTLDGFNTSQVVNMLDGSWMEANQCSFLAGFITPTCIRYDISSPTTGPFLGIDNELILRQCHLFSRTGGGTSAIDCTSATSNGNIRIYNSEITTSGIAIENINSAVDIQTFNCAINNASNAYHFTGAGLGTVTFANMTFNSTLSGAAGALIAINDGAAMSTMFVDVDGTVAPPQVKNSSALGAAGVGAKIDSTAGAGISVLTLAPIEFF